MHRWGTQVDGVVFSPGTSGVAAQVPKPVNDTTQNFGVNGEYKGTSPWGKLFTFKLGYAGSVYEDHLSSYTVAESVLRRHNSAIHSWGGPMRAQRLSVQPVRSHDVVAQQLRAWHQFDHRRRPAVEEPLHGHAFLHLDAAERCVYSFAL